MSGHCSPHSSMAADLWQVRGSALGSPSIVPGAGRVVLPVFGRVLAAAMVTCSAIVRHGAEPVGGRGDGAHIPCTRARQLSPTPFQCAG
jgi:hypothetical protein